MEETRETKTENDEMNHADEGSAGFQEEAPKERVEATKTTSLATRSSRCDGCYRWMNSHHLNWLIQLPRKWPRTMSIIFGVVSFSC